MTTIAGRMRDWSYDEAARRLREAAAVELPGHVARMALDGEGNRVVTCGCGWIGNGYGWVQHTDEVVNDALRD